MSEYFRPSKIWAGKLCYVEGELQTKRVMIPCRINRLKAGAVEVVVGYDQCFSVSVADLYDRIDGPTDFHDVPGGKP